MKKHFLAITVTLGLILSVVPVHAQEVDVTCDIDSNYTVNLPKTITLDANAGIEDYHEEIGTYTISLSEESDLRDDEFIWVGGAELDVNYTKEKGTAISASSANKAFLSQSGKEDLIITTRHYGFLTKNNKKLEGVIRLGSNDELEKYKNTASGKWEGNVTFSVKKYDDTRTKEALTLSDTYTEDPSFDTFPMASKNYYSTPEGSKTELSKLKFELNSNGRYANVHKWITSSNYDVIDHVNNVGQICQIDGFQMSTTGFTYYFEKVSTGLTGTIMRQLREMGATIEGTNGTEPYIKTFADVYNSDTGDTLPRDANGDIQLKLHNSSKWISHEARIHALGYEDVIVKYGYEAGPNSTGTEAILIETEKSGPVALYIYKDANTEDARLIQYRV